MKHIIVLNSHEILHLQELLKLDVETFEILLEEIENVGNRTLARMLVKNDKSILRKLEEAVLLEKS